MATKYIVVESTSVSNGEISITDNEGTTHKVPKGQLEGVPLSTGSRIRIMREMWTLVQARSTKPDPVEKK